MIPNIILNLIYVKIISLDLEGIYERVLIYGGYGSYPPPLSLFLRWLNNSIDLDEDGFLVET